MLAPLAKHDRLHDHDQTVVTIWDLAPWRTPSELPRSVVAWHRAMLKRAVKHADAVVVPTHAMAQRLAEHARINDRLRVIAGAAHRLRRPTDTVGRLRDLALPTDYIALPGSLAPSAGPRRGCTLRRPHSPRMPRCTSW